MGSDPGVRRLALGTLLAAYPGPVPPQWAVDLVGEGLAGHTLFGPNVHGPEQVAASTAALRAARSDVLVAIDDVALTRRVHEAIGAELASGWATTPRVRLRRGRRYRRSRDEGRGGRRGRGGSGRRRGTHLRHHLRRQPRQRPRRRRTPRADRRTHLVRSVTARYSWSYTSYRRSESSFRHTNTSDHPCLPAAKYVASQLHPAIRPRAASGGLGEGRGPGFRPGSSGPRPTHSPAARAGRRLAPALVRVALEIQPG